MIPEGNQAFRRMRAAMAVTAVALAPLLAGCPRPAYPSCAADQDCRGHGEVCVERTCQQCRVDTDCPSDGRCLRNRCFAGRDGCGQDGDCTDGQRCVEQHCVAPPECDAMHACPGGAVCQNGRCMVAYDDGVTERPDPEDNAGRLCRFQPVRFGTDSTQLDEEARRGLATAADCLRRERTTHYTLIGRADARGTVEYNLALGDRRSQAVRRYLQSLGVDETRLPVSSEGEAGATGVDEAGWARDRRVDFRPHQ